MKPSYAILFIVPVLLIGCLPEKKEPSTCYAATMTVDEHAAYEKLPLDQQTHCAINVYDPAKAMDGITVE